MGKKIILEEIEEGKRESKSFTASHIMLYIILGVYIAVSLTCMAFIISCMIMGNEGSAQTLVIPTVSLVGTCSCTVVGFYTNKASKENEIKLSNDKYRMRLEIAKDIFKEYGTTLDDKSIDLLRKLMSDKDVSEIPPLQEQVDWQSTMPQQTEIVPLNNNGIDEGVG